MASPADVRARLLEQLRQRLELAEELAASVRERLTRGDVAGIEAATARIQTVAQEFKVLAEEYRRIPRLEEGGREPEALVQARSGFEATAARVARSSAMAGGLLERMVTVSRGLLAMLGSGGDGAYLPSGRSRDLDPRGIRLREWV